MASGYPCRTPDGSFRPNNDARCRGCSGICRRFHCRPVGPSHPPRVRPRRHRYWAVHTGRKRELGDCIRAGGCRRNFADVRHRAPVFRRRVARGARNCHSRRPGSDRRGDRAGPRSEPVVGLEPDRRPDPRRRLVGGEHRGAPAVARGQQAARFRRGARRRRLARRRGFVHRAGPRPFAGPHSRSCRPAFSWR